MFDDTLKEAVVAVGDGRGFVVQTRREQRLIVTAAHCLPELPPPHAASFLEERTYGELVGSLGEPGPRLWAECAFVDPIGDIAVLTAPDGQALYEECEAYEGFVDALPAFAVGAAPEDGRGWLLSLDGRWIECRLRRHREGAIGIFGMGEAIAGGMSGSPIVTDDGTAVGVVGIGGGERSSGTWGQASLAGNLPGWLLRDLGI